MDKKRILLIAGGILFVIAIIAIIALTSPKGQPSTPTTQGTIKEITLAKGETKDKQPINPTDVFSINDPEVHAIVNYTALSPSTITYQWYDLTNKKTIKEEQRQAQTAFVGLSSANITRDVKTNWGLGSFEFRVLMDGNLIGKRAFKVQTDLDIQKDQVLSSIRSVKLTTGVDLQGNPSRNVSDIFSKDDEDIFASVSYGQLPVSVSFEAKWTYLPEGRLIKTYQKTISGSGVFAFGLNAQTDSWIPVKKWPVGKYILRVYMNGDQVKEIPFTVQ